MALSEGAAIACHLVTWHRSIGQLRTGGTGPPHVNAILSRTSVQEELARLGYSYAHLCRVFKGRFGIPPLRYATYVRLERAKQLLQESGLTVSAVAYRCGFEDPGYFARAFRKYMGVPPSAFLSS